MGWDELLKLLSLGLVVGFLSGLLGIGGAVLVIPMLVLLFIYLQKLAVGTSLAMLLPPIGVFAVARYYEADQVNVRAATILACTFAVGAWLGSRFVQRIDELGLRRMIDGAGGQPWTQRCLGSCPTWSRSGNFAFVALFLAIGLANLAWAASYFL